LGDKLSKQKNPPQNTYLEETRSKIPASSCIFDIKKGTLYNSKFIPIEGEQYFDIKEISTLLSLSETQSYRKPEEYKVHAITLFD
jgi:hypothetical protein